MKKIKKTLLILLLVITIILLLDYSHTFSKYVSSTTWNYFLKSKEFYFSSEYMTPDTTITVDNAWDGGKFIFNIKNSENEIEITDYDIDYEITCSIKGEASTYTKCTLNGTDSNKYTGTLSAYETCINKTGDGVDTNSLKKEECELEGYEWKKQIATNNHYFEVILTDESKNIKDVTVSVEAQSLMPYKKNIKGEFILTKDNSNYDQILTNYVDYTNYGILSLTNNYSVDKNVLIKWNADKLVIENNKEEFETYQTNENNYIETIEIFIKAYETKTYSFYKKDKNETYHVNSFTIKEEI